jgi:hypothetical protein
MRETRDLSGWKSKRLECSSFITATTLTIQRMRWQHSQDAAAMAKGDTNLQKGYEAALQFQIAKLTEERDRYRKALEEIAQWPVQPGMCQKARKALEDLDES